MAKEFRLNKRDKIVAGVCGGLADYFDVDPTLMRVLYAVLTLVTGIVLGVVVYALLAVLAKK